MALIQGTALSEDLYGSSFKDSIFGYGGRDTIEGNAGNDYLVGGQGNDTLYGEDGNDTLSGESGSNSLMGGYGDDLYIIASNSDSLYDYGGLDTVQSLIYSYTLPTNYYIEELVLGAGAAYGYGNDYDNKLTGNNANNFLVGYSGEDTLIGNNGDDTLKGGDGDDNLSGGSGKDIIQGYEDSYEIDTLAGGSGADKFILGSASTTFYLNGNYSYAVVNDFSATQGDKIQINGPRGLYFLVKDEDVIGGPAKDTVVYIRESFGSNDYFAVFPDTTNVNLTRDFIVV